MDFMTGHSGLLKMAFHALTARHLERRRRKGRLNLWSSLYDWGRTRWHRISALRWSLLLAHWLSFVYMRTDAACAASIVNRPSLAPCR